MIIFIDKRVQELEAKKKVAKIKGEIFDMKIEAKTCIELNG